MSGLYAAMRTHEQKLQLALAVFAPVFAVLLAGCGSGGAVQHPAATQRAAGSPARNASENSTQTFPDGTKVTFVSATWVMTPDDDGPAVKFTFHIVAGPGWKQNGKVELRPGSGNERPYNYYMVTANGWSYPSYNSTGYADISNIITAQGSVESGEGANTLFAGDAINASSTLATQSDPQDTQHLLVTIEMPDGKLQSRSYAVNVGPDPFGASPSADAGQPSAEPAGSPTTAPAAVISPGNDTPEDAVDGLLQAELAGDWTQACSYVVPSAQSACSQQASQLPAFTGSGTVVGSVISGSEALVEVTGSICGAGSGCTSNSDPSTGMPNSQVTFDQAYSQALNNSNSSFSPVPCIEENGAWYVNFSQ